MDETFKIFVDRLRLGKKETIRESVSPDFILLKEGDLVFNDQVEIKGEAYVVDQELVMHLDIETQAQLYCSICNEALKVPIRLRNFYHVVALDQIKGAIYDYREMLRETLIVEAPQFAECGGQCPKRKEYAVYMKNAETDSADEKEETYRPFADLNLNPEEFNNGSTS